MPPNTPELLRVISALDKIEGHLKVMASPDESARAMRTHCAETDHALTMRLIDVDVFAVHCVPNCTFHTEWRTR